MKTVKGDLLKLAKNGDFDVIIHGCNCYHVMGGGIAYQIKSSFPEAYSADKQTVVGPTKLGTYSSAVVGDITIVNAYTQNQFGVGSRHADYDAIANVFRLIKKDFHGKRIGYPMIGAGLAGGDWSIISEIIKKELDGEDHTLVVWAN